MAETFSLCDKDCMKCKISKIETVFAAHVKDLAEKLYDSQDEFGRLVFGDTDSGKQRWYRIREGRQSISLDDASKIAEGLHTNVVDLMRQVCQICARSAGKSEGGGGGEQIGQQVVQRKA